MFKVSHSVSVLYLFLYPSNIFTITPLFLPVNIVIAHKIVEFMAFNIFRNDVRFPHKPGSSPLYESQHFRRGHVQRPSRAPFNQSRFACDFPAVSSSEKTNPLCLYCLTIISLPFHFNRQTRQSRSSFRICPSFLRVSIFPENQGASASWQKLLTKTAAKSPASTRKYL